MGTHTPWGEAQHSTKIARGIMIYSTARHGGFHLSATLNDKMPEPLRNQDAWYEEDCEYVKVVLAFPQFFTDRADTIEQAHRTAKDYYPEKYEAWRRLTEPGYEIPLAESWRKREDRFLLDNQNNWVVITCNTSRDPAMLECVAVLGGRNRRGRSKASPEHVYLVPKTEYDKRGEFGFVIDPAKHERLSNNADEPR